MDTLENEVRAFATCPLAPKTVRELDVRLKAKGELGKTIAKILANDFGAIHYLASSDRRWRERVAGWKEGLSTGTTTVELMRWKLDALQALMGDEPSPLLQLARRIAAGAGGEAWEADVRQLREVARESELIWRSIKDTAGTLLLLQCPDKANTDYLLEMVQRVENAKKPLPKAAGGAAKSCTDNAGVSAGRNVFHDWRSVKRKGERSNA